MTTSESLWPCQADLSYLSPLLAQACVPCHKAKRRCDGGLPCSNCDFSGRSCSYSDSHGNAVQPTARARPMNGNGNSSSNNASNANGVAPPRQGDYHDGHPYPNGSEIQASYYTHSSVSPDYSAHHDRFQRPKIAPSYPMGAVGPSSSSSSMPNLNHGSHPGYDQAYEQMHVFRRCAPFNSVLPSIFFTCQARPSHILSLAISSFVSSRSDVASPPNDEYTSSVVRLLVDGDYQSGTAQFEHSSTERALALVLLALHDLSRGRTLGALTLSTAALRMVQELGLHEGVTIPGDVFQPIHCARLVCLVYTVEVLVTAITCKPSCLGELDFAIATSSVSHLATKGEHRGDRVTTAFVALLGSAQVFSSVVQHQRRLALHLPASETDKSKSRCQEALNSWAGNLSSALTFNDANLADASRSGAGECRPDDAWGWAWSMMHCFAEMSVCMLENNSSNGSHRAYHHQRHHSNGSAGRRRAACSNLSVLLDTFSPDTRRSIFALLPVLFAAEGASDVVSARVNGHLTAVRDIVALHDDQLRKTMSYLGTDGTVGGSSLPSPTTLMPKTSPRMRSSSLITRGPPPPFSPLPLPTPPASEGFSSSGPLGSPGRNSALPVLKIPSPSSTRPGIKLPSLSPTSTNTISERRLLPSITTSPPSSTSPTMKSSYKRDDDRTLPPLTRLPSHGSKSAISNTLSPIGSLAR